MAQAYRDLPEKGIHINNFVHEEKAQHTVATILLNNEVMLELWWDYIKDHVPYDNLYDFLKEEYRDGMLERFKEDFWSAVVNFSPAAMRELLIEQWQQIKNEVKKKAKAAQQKNLRNSSTTLSDELE